jgi:GAF domain-containing protein
MKLPGKPANEVDRLAALETSGALADSLRPKLRSIAQDAATKAQTPIGLVTFIGADSAWVQAGYGLPEGESMRHSAFCAWAIHSMEVTWVEDTILDMRYSDNPLVVSEPFIRFYAGAPIVTPDGYALGAVCVIDHTPRQREAGLSDYLNELSRKVTDILACSST